MHTKTGKVFIVTHVFFIRGQIMVPRGGNNSMGLGGANLDYGGAKSKSLAGTNLPNSIQLNLLPQNIPLYLDFK